MRDGGRGADRPGVRLGPSVCCLPAEVRKHTERSCLADRTTVDPFGQRGRNAGKDLDHIVPVKQCYLSGQSPSSCGAASNLRVMDAGQNRSEGRRAPGCRVHK